MTQNRCKCNEHAEAMIAAYAVTEPDEVIAEVNSERAFADIEDERRRAETFGAGANHICCPNVAAADIANVFVKEEAD